MTLSGFISKLNWRLMVVHLVAYWFLWEAFEYFAVFYDYHFLVTFYQHHHFSKHITDDQFRSISPNDIKRVISDRMMMSLFPLLGLITALVSSLITSIMKNRYWLNTVIVFVTTIALIVIWRLYKIQITPWNYLQYIFDKPGYFFRGSIWYFIADGSVLLVIGLCLFFLKPVIRFIDGKKAYIEPLSTEGHTDSYEPKTQF